MPSHRSSMLALAALVLPLALASSCDLTDDGSGGGQVSQGGQSGPGAYQLQSVNGHALPAGFKYAFIVSGTLDVAQDGSFSMRFSWQGDLNESRYTGEDGSWTQIGNTMTFTPNSDPVFTGAPGAGGLVVSYDFDADGTEEQFVYVR